MKKIKGHYIAKLILYIPFVVLGYIYVNVIKNSSTLINYPIKTDNNILDIIKLLSYHCNDIIKDTPEFILWFYIMIIPFILIYILDITVGIGRSRSEERKQKRKLKNEKNTN